MQKTPGRESVRIPSRKPCISNSETVKTCRPRAAGLNLAGTFISTNSRWLGSSISPDPSLSLCLCFLDLFTRLKTVPSKMVSLLYRLTGPSRAQYGFSPSTYGTSLPLPLLLLRPRPAPLGKLCKCIRRALDSRHLTVFVRGKEILFISVATVLVRT